MRAGWCDLPHPAPGAAPTGGGMGTTRIVLLVVGATLGPPALPVALVFTAGWLSRTLG